MNFRAVQQPDWNCFLTAHSNHQSVLSLVCCGWNTMAHKRPQMPKIEKPMKKRTKRCSICKCTLMWIGWHGEIANGTKKKTMSSFEKFSVSKPTAKNEPTAELVTYPSNVFGGTVRWSMWRFFSPNGTPCCPSCERTTMIRLRPAKLCEHDYILLRCMHFLYYSEDTLVVKLHFGKSA